jgi:NAD(P)-dependent dehydrogenase (short-subunit alcohol dehydrogenase family)
MSSVWSYEGMRVVVSGGGGAGMGAATVTELADRGAEIHVLDLKEPPVDVASYQSVDLKDPQAAVAAIDTIGNPIDALFNCAGLPGPPFSDLDTMIVNFVAMRHLAELCANQMPEGGAIASISSTAGVGYLQNIGKWMPLVATDGFGEAKQWCQDHPDEIATGYAPSKEAIIVWTMHSALEFAKRGIRVNCISPGPTETPMMPAFEDFAGKELIDTFAQGAGRRSRPEEQAYPLVFLNSRAASYVSGANFITDGGTLAALMTGNLSMSFDQQDNLG